MIAPKKVLPGSGFDGILAPVMPAPAKWLLRAAKSGGANFCLALFVAIYAMAAVPALHQLVHHDANDPSHECAVTLFLGGQVHCPGTDVEVVKSPPVLISPAPARCADFLSADVRLLPGRGPPSCFFV
jgi:hypothetical protein